MRGLTAVDLFTMMERTPHAGHAPTYAYKVLEESARRQIVAIASRAEQILTTVEGQPLPERLELLGDQRKALAGLVDNWRGGTGNTPELLEQAARTAGSGLPAPEPAALAREDQLLASLIASGSDTIASVKPWLRPDDFQAPGRGGIYQALLALHQRGEPIDAITVMWEANRNGVLAIRGGHDAKSLLDVARTQRVPFPLNQAQQISQEGARRALLASFRGLKGLATSGNTAWDLLVSATRHNLTTARAEHTRIVATRTAGQAARPVNTPTRPVHLPRR
ncbi:MAG: hypothetical protein L0Y54_10315 [Sporichthyaceae bacterium]|nr:hypothetical protein [Sporichthyaceae bacterium]